MPQVQVDASQLEWRTVLELAQDEVGIAEILEKQDVHSLNQVAFVLPSRLIAKIYLFRTIFRGSGYSFANDNDFMHVSKDPKFWDALNEKFFTKYYGINNVHNKWKDLVVAGKPIEGPLGRSWTIGMGRDYKGNLKIPWTLFTNYPVQGTGADVMMIARISAKRRILAAGIPVKWRVTVHDSIVVDCEDQYVQQVVNIFHQVFDDLPMNIEKMFGYKWRVPMDCECKVGPNLKDMKKIKRTDK